ncbi:MAG: hypothetical protein IKS96_07390 [Fibrobacter sp.]|nr:hypothetical protein [Fibrobacter sp.]MBR6449752.1 hypothetical protein [Fibrobacter sp.]
MMDERTKEALGRTWKHLVRHLEDLNDEIDQNDGRIEKHMNLDGIKDAVKTMRCIKELMSGSDHEKDGSTTDDFGSQEPERMSAASALR